MRMLLRFRFYFSHQIAFLFGICIGITLSLILMPLLEENCLQFWKTSVTSNRRPQSISITAAVDEYEPVLHLNTKPKKVAFPEKIQVPRSRYYSTELGIREKLFVGVLSTPQTILTFGSALNTTLSKYADKLLFYLETSETESLDVNSNSVIVFPDKREVLGPFNMLQHITENFLDEYDFFFFAKDTTHVRGKKLLEFVNHISISRDVHLGRTVDPDSLYCSLDGGILLSHSILLRTVKELEWCIQHTFSLSNSDNFGRCILHGTDVPCQSSVQGLSYLSHHVSKYDSLESSIQKSSWPKDLKNVFTIHSVSKPEDHYLIHHYFTQQELADNQHQLQDIQVKISNLHNFLPDNSTETSWPVGIPSPYNPYSRFDVLPWIYFNNTHNFLQSELLTITEIIGMNKLEIQDLLKNTVQWIKLTHNDQFIYQKLINGYKRFDPTRGTEYTLDMLFLEESTGQEVWKRITAMRPLNEVEIVPVPFVTEHTRVVLLLTIQSSERNDALRFLEDYVKTCIEKQDSTVLLLIFLYGPQDPGKGEKEDIFGPVKDIVTSYVTKYRSSGAKIAWYSIKTIGKVPPNYAILDLVSRKLSAESLLLFCHVGMEIHPEYINRVRMNTIIKTQVFFPIPFRQYHLSLAYSHITLPDNVEVKKDFGHIDSKSYEFSSFYLADYLTVRKQLESVIPTVKSDKDLKNTYLYTMHMDLFEIFLQSKLHVMRAVEPDLRVKFRFDPCDLESNVATYHECLCNREWNLGTKAQMAAEVLSHVDHAGRENVQFNGIL